MQDSADDLEPAEPEEEGVPHRDPRDMQIEPARLLANDARPRLHEEGFDDHQIEAWAETFIAQEGVGDVDQFVAWIGERERG